MGATKKILCILSSMLHRINEENADDDIMVLCDDESPTFDVTEDNNRLFPQPQAETTVRSIFPVDTICFRCLPTPPISFYCVPLSPHAYSLNLDVNMLGGDSVKKATQQEQRPAHKSQDFDTAFTCRGSNRSGPPVPRGTAGISQGLLRHTCCVNNRRPSLWCRG